MLIDDFTHSINCIYEEAYALRAYITGMSVELKVVIPRDDEPRSGVWNWVEKKQ